jgi:RNA polymerase sigma-70 factor (ECF subfamily)
MRREEDRPSRQPADPPASDGAPLESLPSVALLSELRKGSDAARDELLRRYWPRLERWAHGRLPRMARDLYETSDLVQETLLSVMRRLDQFEPLHDGALPAYFRAAILNRIRTLATRSRGKGEHVDLEGALADAGPSPIEEVVGRETLERYERALLRLRPDDRMAIQLKVELDLPYPEIARELEKPTLTAARMAVSRALFRLAIEMRRDV